MVAIMLLQVFTEHLFSKECCRKQKQELCEKFDYLYGILEERKNEMSQVITRTQEEKLEHVRALIKKYSDHLENVSKLVESGIQFMDEPEMAVFLQNAKTLLQKISEASKAFQMEKIEHGYENMNHFTVNLNREEKIIREIDFYREDEEEEEEEGEEGEGEGEGEREGEGDREGEEVVEVEKVDSFRTESSGADESPEKASEPSQLASELRPPSEPLPVSSPEPPAALPPAADAPGTQGEVVPTGSSQTTESETPVPAATDTADPLLYPSWYKGQTRKATTNPPSTPGSEGLGHLGPPGSEDSNVQKAEVAEAAASERAAVSGKETSSPAATSQVSVDALVSECFPLSPRFLLEPQQEGRASKGAERNGGLGRNRNNSPPNELGICLALVACLILHYIWRQIQCLIFTLMDQTIHSDFKGKYQLQLPPEAERPEEITVVANLPLARRKQLMATKTPIHSLHPSLQPLVYTAVNPPKKECFLIGSENPPLQGQAAASGSGNGADSEPARHVFSFSWLNSLNE
ncbi:hypothetical protein HPG69_011423 [Diceros bicornis minor]|uniref:RING-type E3 ubiquitin transferase n=1 Tax=Diceros bicornis minor TaxID=77932 RepID=A0A7J7FDY4_DICBM|nr:hypothetical protein HPG69_011423 [Diceros bicornis minor]